MTPTRTYREWRGPVPLHQRVRSSLRDIAIRVLATGRRIDASSGWVRFPYYHHVFEDERQGFEDQLKLLRQFGDFLTMDDAVALLESGDRIDGRYFCVSFDDGLKNCVENALPILVDLEIPSMFYIVTGLVGASLEPDDEISRKTFGFKGLHTGLDFLTWDDCRLMTASGMAIGSHTVSHPRLSSLSAGEARQELAESKSQIERELGTGCRHFCAPYGIPREDFDPTGHPELARSTGYASFAAGQRGPMLAGSPSHFIRRDHLLANWGRHQMAYFFSAK